MSRFRSGSEADLFFNDLLGMSGRARGTAFTEDAEQVAGDPGWCCKRQAMAAIARTEELHWTNPSTNTKLLESSAAQRPFLVRYWMATGQNAATAAASAAQSAANADDFAWSAAFICFVMRAAGITPADGFVFGGRHIQYIVGALRNREHSDQARRFWLVDSVEAQREAIPEPGDLICFNRPVKGVMTTHTYTSLRNAFFGNNGANEGIDPTGSSHCALVVGTTTVGNQRRFETIGGNEANSVRVQTNVVVNQDGGILNPQANASPGPIFGMIKIMRC